MNGRMEPTKIFDRFDMPFQETGKEKQKNMNRQLAVTLFKERRSLHESNSLRIHGGSLPMPRQSETKQSDAR